MLQVTVEVNLDNKRAHARKTTVLYFIIFCQCQHYVLPFYQCKLTKQYKLTNALFGPAIEQIEGDWL
jgi:hypothetical protein